MAGTLLLPCSFVMLVLRDVAPPWVTVTLSNTMVAASAACIAIAIEVFQSRPRRRLHLMIGDANLCEWAQVLRVGTSALVLEAIESGAPVAWPELADPLGALGELNLDPDCSVRLLLRDGSRGSPLEIQQRYLAGVREALGAAPLEAWKTRVLDAWQETLVLLAEDPKDRDAWASLGYCLRAQEKHASAGDALARSTEGSTSPMAGYTLYNAAVEYAKAGRREDAIRTLEKAFAKAIEETAACVPKDIGGGTIQYVADVQFRRRVLTVTAPKDGRSIRSAKVSAACASAVKQRLRMISLEGVAHSHARYKIAITATYRPSIPSP